MDREASENAGQISDGIFARDFAHVLKRAGRLKGIRWDRERHPRSSNSVLRLERPSLFVFRHPVCLKTEMF